MYCSRFVSRRFSSLVREGELEAQLAALADEQAHPDTAESQSRTVRTWLARRLLDDPVLYYRTLSPESRAIRQQTQQSLVESRFG
jgi:hypothetical protein